MQSKTKPSKKSIPKRAETKTHAPPSHESTPGMDRHRQLVCLAPTAAQNPQRSFEKKSGRWPQNQGQPARPVSFLRCWRFLGSLEFSCKELTAQLGASQQVFEFFAIWNLHVILSKLELVFVGDAKLRLADALLSSQEATDESLVIW